MECSHSIQFNEINQSISKSPQFVVHYNIYYVYCIQIYNNTVIVFIQIRRLTNKISKKKNCDVHVPPPRKNKIKNKTLKPPVSMYRF